MTAVRIFISKRLRRKFEIDGFEIVAVGIGPFSKIERRRADRKHSAHRTLAMRRPLA